MGQSPYLQPPASSLRSSSLAPSPYSLAPRGVRRAISLLEVLVSMGILAVGLLSIAALIPAGRHEIVSASRLDRAAALGRSAFREIKVRHFLKPGDASGSNWKRTGGPVVDVWNPVNGTLLDSAGTDTLQVFAVLDPLAAIAPTAHNPAFPHGGNAITLDRIVPFVVAQNNRLADDLFRSPDDPVVTDGASAAAPPVQFASGGKRSSQGDYSWLATIVSNPASSALSGKVTVSVAVFHKRDLATPAATESVGFPTTFSQPLIGGGEVVMTLSNINAKGAKPGQWVMLAGATPPPNSQQHFRWYRVTMAEKPGMSANGTIDQRITIAGPDWYILPPANLVQVWLLEGVVAVYEKEMRLEVE